jgi:hypothetical protein
MVNGDVDGGAQSDLSREGSGYPSDLRDAEWARLAPLIPEASPGGRPRKTRHARGDERHLLFAAHWVALTLSAPRQLSAPLDRLQHLSQVTT